MYERGTLIANGVYGLSDEEMIEISHQEMFLDLNMAFCAVKLGRWRDAISCAQMALQLENTAKGHYRMAQAWLGLLELDNAQEELMLAAELQPDDKTIEKQLAQIEVKRGQLAAKQREREKQMAQAMMGSKPPLAVSVAKA